MQSLLGDISLTDVITMLSVIVAAIYYMHDKRRENRYATMEAYRTMQRDIFSELNRWSPSEIEEAMENRNSDAYKKLGEYLSGIEFFCVGLNQGIYDFRTFYAIAHGYFDQEGILYRRLIPMLGRKLEGSKEDYYQNIHKVWKRMDKESRRCSFWNLW